MKKISTHLYYENLPDIQNVDKLKKDIYYSLCASTHVAVENILEKLKDHKDVIAERIVSKKLNKENDEKRGRTI